MPFEFLHPNVWGQHQQLITQDIFYLLMTTASLHRFSSSTSKRSQFSAFFKKKKKMVHSFCNQDSSARRLDFYGQTSGENIIPLHLTTNYPTGGIISQYTYPTNRAKSLEFRLLSMLILLSSRNSCGRLRIRILCGRIFS